MALQFEYLVDISEHVVTRLRRIVVPKHCLNIAVFVVMVAANIDYCLHIWSMNSLPLTIFPDESEAVNEMSQVVSWNVGGCITLLRV